MRQLAVFESAEHARRLAAYLVTQRVTAHAEQEPTGFVVWVQDEDHLPQAREVLTHFRDNPGDTRYDGAESVAAALRRKEEAEHAARQKNLVEMRGRWGSGAGIRRKAPLTIGLILVSVLVFIATSGGEIGPDGPQGLLPKLTVVEPELLARSYHEGRPDYFASLRAGQVWRAISPIFIHYGITHLVFNMWWMYVLAGQVEDRRGPWRFAVLVLTLAVTSVLASALVNQLQGDLALAGGMSGVGYGIFGYLWMRVKFAPGDGFDLNRVTVIVGVVWLVLCILRDVRPFDDFLGGLIQGRVDNTGHLVGLAVGMAVGYAPLLLWRR